MLTREPMGNAPMGGIVISTCKMTVVHGVNMVWCFAVHMDVKGATAPCAAERPQRPSADEMG
jgi:hypothetical protein